MSPILIDNTQSTYEDKEEITTTAAAVKDTEVTDEVEHGQSIVSDNGRTSGPEEDDQPPSTHRSFVSSRQRIDQNHTVEIDTRSTMSVIINSSGTESLVRKLIIVVLISVFVRNVWSQMELTSRLITKDHEIVKWEDRREEVKRVFELSWNAYSRYAWGKDCFHPISKTGSQMSQNGLGWTIVDSLDTMMIMNMTTQVRDAHDWILGSLNYDQPQDVNTFETTIRMLGGLLSAHYLYTRDVGDSSPGSVYLNKSIDLADRLLGAYNSPSGIPYASVDLRTSHGIRSHMDGGASSTAEVSTLQLEMKYLAQITGNETYWRKAEKIMEVLDGNNAKDGLVPIFVHPDTGKFTTPEIRLGSRGDSYYEYLIKQYLQTGELIYLDMWNQALDGIRAHLVTNTKEAGLHIVAELPTGIGGSLSPKMDHLVCFLPGSIALGVTGGLTIQDARRLPSWNAYKDRDMRLAKELTKTCWAMYEVTRTRLAPEIAWFKVDERALEPEPGCRYLPPSNDSREAWVEDFTIKSLDAHNLQRPETLESLFIMYRITEDPMYREWGWKIFQAFREHSLVEDGEGFTSLDDVTVVPVAQRDNMESFWLAETLKYLYLLFSPSDILPLTEIVLNTEAHVLPILERPRFETGWKRNRTAAHGVLSR